ncbi:DNA polymerase III subunit psi [Vibrio sp. NH-UV-68]
MANCMQIDQLPLLHEMGIDYYQLDHPERLQGYQAPSITIDPSCRLLLVAPQCPSEKSAQLFERVLSSINLTLADARYLVPNQLSLVTQHNLEWVWFAGCEVDESISAKALVSPRLSDIVGNNQQRRALWQQICSYQ